MPHQITAEEVFSDEIVLSWEPPPFEERNGVITKYGVKLYEGQDTTQMVTNHTKSTRITISNLEPNTAYVVQVKAYTSVGGGPYSEEFVVNTPPESKCSMCYITMWRDSMEYLFKARFLDKSFQFNL